MRLCGAEQKKLSGWKRRLAEGRQDILRVHTARKPLAEDVKIEELAKADGELLRSLSGRAGRRGGDDSHPGVRPGGKVKGEAHVCEYRLEAKRFEEALKIMRLTALEEGIYKRLAGA